MSIAVYPLHIAQLHTAVKEGRIEQIKQLIESEANLNEFDSVRKLLVIFQLWWRQLHVFSDTPHLIHIKNECSVLWVCVLCIFVQMLWDIGKP